MSRKKVRHSAKIVARRRVGLNRDDQIAVFLHALGIVAGHEVEEAASAVSFPFGHAVE